MTVLFTKYKLAYFLMIIVFALPLLLITNDIWDGSLVAYGFRTDDLSGIRGIYLGNYVRWDPKAQHEEMIKIYQYETSSFQRS